MNNTLAIKSINFPFSITMPSWLGLGLLFRITLVLFSACFIILLGFYVFQIGDLIAKSYALKGLENQTYEMHRDNNTLVAVDAYSSLNQIEKQIQQLNFVRAENIKYIPLNPKQLVLKVK